MLGGGGMGGGMAGMPGAPAGPQLGGMAGMPGAPAGPQLGGMAGMPGAAAAAGEKPKFLASETASRPIAPVEPWAGSLRAVMIVFGLLLVGTFVAPWMTVPKVQFSWQLLSGEGPAAAKLLPITIAVSGLLSLVLGLAPASAKARGYGAAAAALLIFGVFGVAVFGKQTGDALGWRGYALLVSLLLGPPGLLLRAKYPASVPARVLGTIAGVAMLAIFLVPFEGKVPLAALKEATDGAQGIMKAVAYGLYVVFAAGAASLLVWMPPTATPMTTLIAWVNIVAVPFLITLTMAFAGSGMEFSTRIFMEAPVLSIYPIVWFAGAMSLFAYGLATVIGKSHEQQSIA
jgi:hypothetical protein